MRRFRQSIFSREGTSSQLLPARFQAAVGQQYVGCDDDARRVTGLYNPVVGCIEPELQESEWQRARAKPLEDLRYPVDPAYHRCRLDHFLAAKLTWRSRSSVWS